MVGADRPDGAEARGAQLVNANIPRTANILIFSDCISPPNYPITIPKLIIALL